MVIRINYEGFIASEMIVFMSISLVSVKIYDAYLLNLGVILSQVVSDEGHIRIDTKPSTSIFPGVMIPT